MSFNYIIIEIRHPYTQKIQWDKVVVYSSFVDLIFYFTYVIVEIVICSKRNCTAIDMHNTFSFQYKLFMLKVLLIL